MLIPKVTSVSLLMGPRGAFEKCSQAVHFHVAVGVAKSEAQVKARSLLVELYRVAGGNPMQRPIDTQERSSLHPLGDEFSGRTFVPILRLCSMSQPTSYAAAC